MDINVCFILEPSDKAGLGEMFKSLNTRYCLCF